MTSDYESLMDGKKLKCLCIDLTLSYQETSFLGVGDTLNIVWFDKDNS